MLRMSNKAPDEFTFEEGIYDRNEYLILAT